MPLSPRGATPGGSTQRHRPRLRRRLRGRGDPAKGSQPACISRSVLVPTGTAVTHLRHFEAASNKLATSGLEKKVG